MGEVELSPCHNLRLRAVAIFVMDAAGTPTKIGHALTCGKDGWMGDRKVECWKVLGVKQVRGAWPADLGPREVRDLTDGKCPIYRHESGYFLERNMLGLYELMTNAPRKRVEVDVKAAAAGDVAEAEPSAEPAPMPEPVEEAFE